jgi:hypothetical protein
VLTAIDLCHHRDAGQPMPFSSSSCCSSFLTHTLQLLFICLEIVGVVHASRCMPVCALCCVAVRAQQDLHTLQARARPVVAVCSTCSWRPEPILSFHSARWACGIWPATSPLSQRHQVCSYASAIAGAVVTPTPASLQLQVPHVKCSICANQHCCSYRAAAVLL